MLSEEALLVFRAHHGMATRSMLTLAGMSRRAREAAVAAGLIEPFHHRVFHIVSSPLSTEARCVALCLAYPRGFITGPTGGGLMTLRRMPKTDLIHFAVPHGSNIGPIDGVELRQTTKVLAHHVVRRGDGIRIASPARLAFDLARDLPPLDHRSVVEQLLKERRTTPQALARVAKELVHPARPGSSRYLATLMSREGRPAESHPEVIVADGLRRRDIPIVLQFGSLRLPTGKVVRLDIAVPAARWAVEVDIHPDHLYLEGTTIDKRRDRGLHKLGWQVERVTELDLLDVEGLCDELADLYRGRCEFLRQFQ